VSAAHRHEDPRIDRLVRWYETLSAQSLEGIGELYREMAVFKDPFNEVRGLAAIRAVFEHMFATLQQPRFVVRDIVAQGEQCFLAWEFHFVARGMGAQRQTIRGATHLCFAGDGRVAWHRDYWDAAEELYEKPPLLGALMRWLKRRARG
jgi:steroid Delta-isomerase